jgi:hypothetical protein
MVTRRSSPRALLVLLATLVACVAQDAAGCFLLTISTGVRGKLKHISDDGSPDSPGAGRTIVVFRADEPGLQDRRPTDASNETVPPEKRNFLSAPDDKLGPPVASAVTGSDGRFQIELAPGDYALTIQSSTLYVPFQVVDGGVTSCSYRWGYRFSHWGCSTPE